MGAIVLDASKVNSYVLPNLVKSKNTMQEAYSTSQSLRSSLPSSFTQRSIVNDIVNQIYDINKEIKNVSLSLEKKLENANKIQSNADNRVRSLSTSVSKVAMTAVGAIIGTSTGGVVGSVVGATNGATVGKTDTNTNNNTGAKQSNGFVSAVKGFFVNAWNGIKDTAAKIANAVKSIWEKFSGSIKSIGKKVVDATKKVGKAIYDTGAKVVEATVSGVKKIGSAIVDGFKWLGSKVVSGVKTAAKWVGDTAKKVTDWISDAFKSVKDWTCQAIKDTGAFISNLPKNIYNYLKDLVTDPIGTLKKTAASIANCVLSVIKGFVSLVEAIGDFIILVGTAINTLGTGFIDILNGVFTGNWDWSATKRIWDETKAIVSYNCTNSMFDALYNTGFGKWLDDNAYDAFKSDGMFCKILEGVGYVTGVITLTIFTFGTATPIALATIATVAGIGKYTAEEWNKNCLSITYGDQEIGLQIEYEKYLEIEKLGDGESTTIKQQFTDENGNPFELIFTITKSGDAYSIVDSYGNQVGFNGIKESDTVKGLLVGGIKGAWEGVQYYVGGQIGSAQFTSVTSKMASPLAKTLFRAGTRVALDIGTGVLEVPFQSVVTMLADGKSWDESWEANGGWNAVLTQAGISGLASFAGEAFSFKGNLGTERVNTALLSGDTNLIDDALKNADPKYINRAINELNDVQFKELVDNGMLSNDTVIKNLDNVTKGKMIEVLSAADEVDGNKIKQVTDSMSSKELSNMIADKTVSGKAKFEILGTVKDETRFKEIGKGMGYQADSLDMYLKQLSSDSNWDSTENLRNALLDDKTGKKVKEVLGFEYAEFEALPKDAQRNMVSSSTEFTRIQDVDLQNKIAASSQTLLATKTAADNGMYTISADDVIIARMNAKNGVYTPAKDIIIDGKSYTELFPGCDEFISNKALVDYTKKLAKIDDSTLVDFAATLGKKYEGNELEVLAKYLETQVDPTTGISKLSVKGKIFQNASPGKANFVSYGGDLGNTAQVPGNYNITGGAYMLLSDNETMAKNFTDCCKLGPNKELIITNYELFGKKALSGVPLNNVDGVYMFDCEVPLEFKNISIPSVNNGSMYTAYGVPGGYLLSGEMETVISGTHIDEIFKQSSSIGYMGEQIVDGKKIVGYWFK